MWIVSQAVSPSTPRWTLIMSMARLLIPWWVSALGSNHIPSGIASWRGRAKSWSLGNISAYHFLKRSVLGGVAPWIDGEERKRRGSQHKAPSMAVRTRQTAPRRFLAGGWSLRTHHTSSNRRWRIEEAKKRWSSQKQVLHFLLGQREPGMHAERTSRILNWGHQTLFSPPIP